MNYKSLRELNFLFFMYSFVPFFVYRVIRFICSIVLAFNPIWSHRHSYDIDQTAWNMNGKNCKIHIFIEYLKRFINTINSRADNHLLRIPFSIANESKLVSIGLETALYITYTRISTFQKARAKTKIIIQISLKCTSSQLEHWTFEEGKRENWFSVGKSRHRHTYSLDKSTNFIYSYCLSASSIEHFIFRCVYEAMGKILYNFLVITYCVCVCILFSCWQLYWIL